MLQRAQLLASGPWVAGEVDWLSCQLSNWLQRLGYETFGDLNSSNYTGLNWPEGSQQIWFRILQRGGKCIWGSLKLTILTCPYMWSKKEIISMAPRSFPPSYTSTEPKENADGAFCKWRVDKLIVLCLSRPSDLRISKDVRQIPSSR